MADRPDLTLEFLPEGCPDCGRRTAVMPRDPVAVPDDFDWSVRDFEGFRRIMLEDLAAADPERARWTNADIEVALVEVLAAGLDRASFALDDIFAERFVATARRPEALINLIRMIDGIDPAWSAVAAELVAEEQDLYGFANTTSQADQVSALSAALTARPQLMDIARTAGLSQLGEIASFITLADLEAFLALCPAIAQVATRARIEAGDTVFEAVILLTATTLRLHDLVSDLGTGQQGFEDFFMAERDRAIPPDQAVHPLRLIDGAALATFSIRTALARLIQPLLPIGTRLRLLDGTRVGVFARLCVHVETTFFRSEVELAVRQRLSTDPGAFFDPKAFGLGTPLVLSDLVEALMSIPGVAGVVVSRLQIAGRPGTEATATGVLTPGPQEALTLDLSEPGSETGYLMLVMTGGQLG